MKLFGNFQKIDEKVNDYQGTFFNYLNSENNDIRLNEIFTEITILRIKLDSHDNILVNYFDSKKLSSKCNKKDLIKLQFEDLLKTSKVRKYTDEKYKLIDDVMKNILHNQQLSDWEKFWKWVGQCLDKATGRK